MSNRKKEWDDCFLKAVCPRDLVARLRRWAAPHEKMQEPRLQVGVTRKDGPMYFLGMQIVKRMERSGFPSKIHCCYRSPEKQNDVFEKGHSKVREWESAHQYYEAVDIVHKYLYWDASPGYWDHLATVVRVVAKEYGVELVHGHNWKFVDSAHIELKSWRAVRDRQREQNDGGNHTPTPKELRERFLEVLPSEAPAPD
ncbi:MAG: hypothetical protein JKY31_08335 [Rhodobacteraceae bacterium]|nr:hypothetical protein [Paracoccaceae bacterium]